MVTLSPQLDFGDEAYATMMLSTKLAMMLSTKLEFGEDAFASIGFRPCRFRLNWISAINWISAMTGASQFVFGNDAFASFGLTVCQRRSSIW